MEAGHPALRRSPRSRNRTPPTVPEAAGDHDVGDAVALEVGDHRRRVDPALLACPYQQATRRVEHERRVERRDDLQPSVRVEVGQARGGEPSRLAGLDPPDELGARTAPAAALGGARCRCSSLLARLEPTGSGCAGTSAAATHHPRRRRRSRGPGSLARTRHGSMRRRACRGKHHRGEQPDEPVRPLFVGKNAHLHLDGTHSPAACATAIGTGTRTRARAPQVHLRCCSGHSDRGRRRRRARDRSILVIVFDPTAGRVIGARQVAVPRGRCQPRPTTSIHRELVVHVRCLRTGAMSCSGGGRPTAVAVRVGWAGLVPLDVLRQRHSRREPDGAGRTGSGRGSSAALAVRVLSSNAGDALLAQATERQPWRSWRSRTMLGVVGFPRRAAQVVRLATSYVRRVWAAGPESAHTRRSLQASLRRAPARADAAQRTERWPTPSGGLHWLVAAVGLRTRDRLLCLASTSSGRHDALVRHHPGESFARLRMPSGLTASVTPTAFRPCPQGADGRR